MKTINMAARRAARVGRARAAANKAAAQAEARRKWEAGEETIVNFYGSDFEAGRGVGEITWAE